MSTCDVDYKSWSLQYIFDIVTDHLLAQNKKSVLDERCLYRSPDGCKCAAGFLIPDAEYDPKFECNYVDSVSFFQKFDEHQISFIRKLQSIHDHYGVWEWKFKLQELAQNRGLAWRDRP